MDLDAINRTLNVLEGQIRNGEWEAAADSAEHVRVLIRHSFPEKSERVAEDKRAALCEDADGSGMGDVDDFVAGPRQFDLGAQGA